MCGLGSIFAYHASAPRVDPEELGRIGAGMVARGPDDSGIWLSSDGRVGQVHRRLAILDLTPSGHQPMSRADGRLRIVFNGEIYNYARLKDELVSAGHVFTSTSDTEVVLAGYLEYGAAIVERLRGMFAFAIWDSTEDGLLIARDHFGIKPLYYHDDGRQFRLASQVKALLGGRGINPPLDPAGVVGFHLWGAVPEPFTTREGIRSLPAGHTMWIDRKGPGKPTPYFDIVDELQRAQNSTPREIVADVVRTAVRDSVAHHLVSDVPVGVFLSSGLDSSVIASLASEHRSDLHAVTLGFREHEDRFQNEIPGAVEMARALGCRHHVSWISKSDFDESLEDVLNAMDLPTIDGVNTYFVARESARAGLKVALSGVGGDELLSGYPSFQQIPWIVRAMRVFAGHPRLGRSFRAVSGPLLSRRTSPKYAGLLEYGGSFGGAYLLRRGLFMPWELPEILDGDVVRKGWERLQPVLALDRVVNRLSSPRARVMALEMSHYMRNMLLRDADWAGMAHSLEIRTPFVDVGIFRALAAYVSTSDAPRKRDLREAAPLPDPVKHRKKSGFAIPVGEWMNERFPHHRGLRGWALHVAARAW